MNLFAMLDILESKGLGVKEESLFISMMPAGVNKAIMLRDPLTGTVIDHELPGYYRTTFQMIIRATGHAEGETRAKAAVSELTFEEETVAGMYFRYCRPETLPVVYPLSDGNLLEFSVKMCVCFSQPE